MKIKKYIYINHYTSKTIKAGSFKLGQLIEDDEEINW